MSGNTTTHAVYNTRMDLIMFHGIRYRGSDIRIMHTPYNATAKKWPIRVKGDGMILRGKRTNFFFLGKDSNGNRNRNNNDSITYPANSPTGVDAHLPPNLKYPKQAVCKTFIFLSTHTHIYIYI